MSEAKRLYYFASSKDALLDIKEAHIKISNLNEVNDPYELLESVPTILRTVLTVR